MTKRKVLVAAAVTGAFAAGVAFAQGGAPKKLEPGLEWFAKLHTLQMGDTAGRAQGATMIEGAPAKRERIRQVLRSIETAGPSPQSERNLRAIEIWQRQAIVEQNEEIITLLEKVARK